MRRKFRRVGCRDVSAAPRRLHGSPPWNAPQCGTEYVEHGSARLHHGFWCSAEAGEVSTGFSVVGPEADSGTSQKTPVDAARRGLHYRVAQAAAGRLDQLADRRLRTQTHRANFAAW